MSSTHRCGSHTRKVAPYASEIFVAAENIGTANRFFSCHERLIVRELQWGRAALNEALLLASPLPTNFAVAG